MYRISSKSIKTEEEKIAVKIADLMANFTIDIEKVGFYLATATPYLLFRRALEVLESAEFQLDIAEQKRIQYRHDNR